MKFASLELLSGGQLVTKLFIIKRKMGPTWMYEAP